MKFEFPELPAAGAWSPEMELLRGMQDLSKVVVVAGYGEVGPWGSSRTRWEMEAFGEFSPSGWLELAWMTGPSRYPLYCRTP